MNIRRTIKGIICFAATLLLLFGCAKENLDTPGRKDGKARISFSAPIIVEQATASSQQASGKAQPTTRAALTEKTTVRVVAFTSTNPAYTSDQAYFVDSDGKLKPCTVNADGSFKAVDRTSELALYPDKYDFYAITPALPLGANKNSVTVLNGIDYASSVTSNISISNDQTLTLTQLDRKCAKIALVIKKGDDNTLMTAFSVASGGVTINNLAPSATTASLNATIAQASGTATLNVPQSVFNTISTTETSAITYLLPRLGENRINLTYNLTYTVSGTSETKDVNGSMGNTTLEAGKSYTFTLTMRQAGASLAVTEWIDGGSQDVVAGESLDYTDNEGSWFLIATGDAVNPVDGTTVMDWYQANGVVHTTNPDGKKACSNGWRVPTIDDAQIVWIYENAMPDFHLTTKTMTDYVWTATEIASNVWGVGRIGGTITKISKNVPKNLRCIRNVSSPTKKYPYVEKDASGKAVVIVSRDVFGGIKRGALHQTWQITPSHNYTQPSNKVSAKLVVAANNCNEQNAPGVTQVNGTYVWSDIDAACAAYFEDGASAGSWRSPTYRELQLICLMYSKNMITDITIPSINYWTKTEGLIETIGWKINMTTQETEQVYKVNSYSVRCVRDVQ